MKLPKLYRKVYLVAHEEHDEDDQYTNELYLRASLALDDQNNKFWQIEKGEYNICAYEFSDLDIYDLSVKWSAHKDPRETAIEQKYKHDPECCSNRLAIGEKLYFEDIPF